MMSNSFRDWLVNEAAIDPNSIRYDAQGRPNFRVYIMNDGGIVGLETLQNGQYKFAGDMFSNIFGDSSLLKGRKIFNWHSELPEGSGYGPMFYDICMEIATIKGGHLASMTLVNRLALISSGKDFDYEQSKERKGAAMGDTSDRAEPIYKFYYEKRGDVEKVDPGVRVANDPEQASKPWMYMLYSKKPTVMTKLIEMNHLTQPVLVSGTGMNAKAIMDFDFRAVQQGPEKQSQKQPESKAGQAAFQGFSTNDTRTWQQRQQHLNSLGIDTAGWGRAEVMRGVQNK